MNIQPKASGVPDSIEQFQLALNAAWAGGKIVGAFDARARIAELEAECAKLEAHKVALVARREQDAAESIRLHNRIAELEASQPTHDSDCSMHNMPASPNGQCDCNVSMIAQRPHIPGWQFVPIEPTKQMMVAAVISNNGNAVYKNVAADALEIEEQIYAEVYSAMLAKSPNPPVATEPLEAAQSGEAMEEFCWLCETMDEQVGYAKPSYISKTATAHGYALTSDPFQAMRFSNKNFCQLITVNAHSRNGFFVKPVEHGFHAFVPTEYATEAEGEAYMAGYFDGEKSTPTPPPTAQLDAMRLAQKAIRILKGALLQLSPCAEPECLQEQSEWFRIGTKEADAAIAALEKAFAAGATP